MNLNLNLNLCIEIVDMICMRITQVLSIIVTWKEQYHNSAYLLDIVTCISYLPYEQEEQKTQENSKGKIYIVN